jgi:hypothetical protein
MWRQLLRSCGKLNVQVVVREFGVLKWCFLIENSFMIQGLSIIQSSDILYKENVTICRYKKEQDMQKTIYLTHLTILLFFIGTSNSETVTADIIQGYSWEYSVSYSEGNGVEEKSGKIKVSIDSVWNDSNDTLFFRVNRADSIYSKIKHSTILNKVQIYVKKINGQLICNSDLIYLMFNKYDYRQHDSTDYMGYGTSLHYNIGTTVYHNETLRTYTYSSEGRGPGSHYYEDLNITDKIGMTSWVSGQAASSSPLRQEYTLKKYCGRDFPATASIKKNVIKTSKTPKESLLKFYKTISFNNKNQGVTLLGRTGAWKNGSFAIILIQKRKTN